MFILILVLCSYEIAHSHWRTNIQQEWLAFEHVARIHFMALCLVSKLPVWFTFFPKELPTKPKCCMRWVFGSIWMNFIQMNRVHAFNSPTEEKRREKKQRGKSRWPLFLCGPPYIFMDRCIFHTHGLNTNTSTPPNIWLQSHNAKYNNSSGWHRRKYPGWLWFVFDRIKERISTVLCTRNVFDKPTNEKK